MTPVLVIGATGSVGSHVVDELLGRGVPVRAFVRDRARASTVLDGRVEPADGDVIDPASIRAALDGVERVFLCTPNHPQQAEHETNVIDGTSGGSTAEGRCGCCQSWPSSCPSGWVRCCPGSNVSPDSLLAFQGPRTMRATC